MLVTLSFISFTRIFFRSENLTTVWMIFDRIKNYMGAELILQILMAYKNVMLVLLLAYLIHWVPEAWKAAYRQWFSGLHPVLMGVIAMGLVFLAYQLMSGEMQAFIYFQF